MINRIAVLIAFVIASGASAASAPDTRPDLMFSAGDSITAAFIANTEASHNSADTLNSGTLRPPAGEYPDLTSMFAEVDNGIEPMSMEWQDGAEQWMQLAQNLQHKSSLSWATGQNIHSHLLRLKEYLAKQPGPQRDLWVFNVAVSGAMVKDLEAQADEILGHWLSDRYHEVRYITVLIGANDACSDLFPGGTPADDMAWELRKFFKKLSTIDQSNPIRVLVVGTPRIPDLGFAQFNRFWLNSRYTCAGIRRVTKFCPSLIDWKTPDEYWRNVVTVYRKNAIMEHVSTESRRLYPNLDVQYVNPLFDAGISIRHLAQDCFHPNAEGQEEISELLWKAQPWFK